MGTESDLCSIERKHIYRINKLNNSDLFSNKKIQRNDFDKSRGVYFTVLRNFYWLIFGSRKLLTWLRQPR